MKERVRNRLTNKMYRFRGDNCFCNLSSHESIRPGTVMHIVRIEEISQASDIITIAADLNSGRKPYFVCSSIRVVPPKELANLCVIRSVHDVAMILLHDLNGAMRIDHSKELRKRQVLRVEKGPNFGTTIGFFTITMLLLTRCLQSSSLWPKNKLLKCITHHIFLIWLRMTSDFPKVKSALKGRGF
jgi:hypothetical protein